VSGIVAVLATGGRALDARELIALRASAEAPPKTSAKQWNDTVAALAASLLTVDTVGRRGTSLAAHQSLDLACAFDGQLHNAAELRANLGGVLNDRTDAELALEAYARWGETFAGRLRGEYALILWDAHAKRLICAHDPIGIKALYLHQKGNSFVVSSDLVFLLSICERATPINAKAIAAYLSGDPLTTDTFYEGVVKLPASMTRVVSARDGAQRTFRHWNISDIKPVRYSRSEEYAEHFRSIFSDAVRCRLSGACRTGLLLSGGLDSSSIACIASRILSAESKGAGALLTFSATSDQCKPDADGDIFDETPYIREVVGAYGIDARFFRYEDFLDENELLAPGARPLPIPPGMGVYKKMLRSARDSDVTVMLSGIGGDEVLGASSEIYLLRYAELLSSGNTAELIEDLRHAHEYYPWSKVAGLLWRFGCWPLLSSLLGRFSMDSDRQSSALSVSQDRIYLELLSGELAGYGLEAFNLICSEADIEARFPYLDTRVVEFCLAIPSAELGRHYQTKLLLRRAMAGILPEKVRMRVGKATTMSLTHTWLSQTIRPNVEALLAHPTLLQGVDWKQIRNLFKEFCGDTMAHGPQISKAIGLELWHRANNQGGPRNGFR
jgi:asparagine synthase (glutamine-hydrolysing)